MSFPSRAAARRHRRTRDVCRRAASHILQLLQAPCLPRHVLLAHFSRTRLAPLDSVAAPGAPSVNCGIATAPCAAQCLAARPASLPCVSLPDGATGDSAFIFVSTHSCHTQYSLIDVCAPVVALVQPKTLWPPVVPWAILDAPRPASPSSAPSFGPVDLPACSDQVGPTCTEADPGSEFLPPAVFNARHAKVTSVPHGGLACERVLLDVLASVRAAAEEWETDDDDAYDESLELLMELLEFVECGGSTNLSVRAAVAKFSKVVHRLSVVAVARENLRIVQRLAARLPEFQDYG